MARAHEVRRRTIRPQTTPPSSDPPICKHSRPLPQAARGSTYRATRWAVISRPYSRPSTARRYRRCTSSIPPASGVFAMAFPPPPTATRWRCTTRTCSRRTWKRRLSRRSTGLGAYRQRNCSARRFGCSFRSSLDTASGKPSCLRRCSPTSALLWTWYRWSSRSPRRRARRFETAFRTTAASGRSSRVRPSTFSFRCSPPKHSKAPTPRPCVAALEPPSPRCKKSV